MKQLMISLFLTLLVVGLTFGQGITASGIGYINVGILGGVAVGDATIEMADLVAGGTYRVYFNPGAGQFEYVDPYLDPTGAQTPSDWTPFEVVATPGAAIQVTFDLLPTKLTSDLGGIINLSYPRAWAGPLDGSADFPFDPYAPYTYQLPFGVDTFYFIPEITFDIPVNTPPASTFSGIMVATVAYTGF